MTTTAIRDATANFDRKTSREISHAIFAEYHWHDENENEYDAKAWLNAYNRFLNNFRDVKEFEKSLSKYVSNLKYRANQISDEMSIDDFFNTDAWKNYVANKTVLEFMRNHILPKYV
jgi:hypothetical protein